MAISRPALIMHRLQAKNKICRKIEEEEDAFGTSLRVKDFCPLKSLLP
jgi:hypothetical protein